MHRLRLNQDEIGVLDRQDSSTASDGGWQGLLVHLQRAVDRVTGEIVLESRDVARIGRYAFDYGRGGWENRLREIFGRTLGPNLGR